MDALQAFVLPVRGLNSGWHHYDFQLDRSFFAAFEQSPIQAADIKLELAVDRRIRDLVLHFSFSGKVNTDCDRCMTPIELPVEGKQQLLVKITNDPEQVSDDPEMIYLHYEEAFLQIAPFAYEFVLLALPMVKTYACRETPPFPCDEDMLNKIAEAENLAEETENDQPSSSPWDVLKDWNK